MEDISLINKKKENKMKLNNLKYLTVLVSLGFTTLYAEGLLYKNRETVLKLIKNDYISLNNVDDIYKKDRELVLIAIKTNNYNFNYIDESLKNDKEILEEAFIRGERIDKRDNNRTNNRAFVLEFIKNNMDSLHSTCAVVFGFFLKCSYSKRGSLICI